MLSYRHCELCYQIYLKYIKKPAYLQIDVVAQYLYTGDTLGNKLYFAVLAFQLRLEEYPSFQVKLRIISLRASPLSKDRDLVEVHCVI